MASIVTTKFAVNSIQIIKKCSFKSCFFHLSASRNYYILNYEFCKCDESYYGTCIMHQG